MNRCGAPGSCTLPLPLTKGLWGANWVHDFDWAIPFGELDSASSPFRVNELVGFGGVGGPTSEEPRGAPEKDSLRFDVNGTGGGSLPRGGGANDDRPSALIFVERDRALYASERVGQSKPCETTPRARDERSQPL